MSELKDMKACYRVVIKGIVRNSEGKILFVKERDSWDLPGGGLEHGEQVLEGISREFVEELNTDVVIDGSLPKLLPTWNSKFDAPVFIVAFPAKINSKPASTDDVSEFKYLSLAEAEADLSIFDTTIPPVLRRIFA